MCSWLVLRKLTNESGRHKPFRAMAIITWLLCKRYINRTRFKRDGALS